MTEEIVGVLLGLGFLHAFFRTVESRWPSSYHTLTSGAAYAISRSPARYLLFRFGPVVAVASSIAVILGRNGQHVVAPLVALAVIHWLVTSGRAALSALGTPDRPRRSALVMMHLLVLGMLLAATGLALAVDEEVAPLVPSGDAVAESLWTALAAAVVGAYLVHLSAPSSIDTDATLQRSKVEIGRELWAQAETTARRLNADPKLIHAFMLVENIHRPRWFRFLERHIKGRVIPHGTYGVLQVAADHPIDEEIALDRAIAEHFAGVQLPTSSYGDWIDDDHLRGFAMNYNPSSDYADLIADAYSWLRFEQRGGLM